MTTPTLLTPHGYSSSSCGYCTPSGSRSERASSKKYGMEAPQMSVQFYQDMIDKGWRRSGDYMYRPDMARTCCPQYTIRLDALAFKPSKKQKQVMNRWNRYLSTGQKPGEVNEDQLNEKNGSAGVDKGKGKQKGKGKEDATWVDTLREWQDQRQPPSTKSGKHVFETEFVPAKATPDTYELYKKYQIAVHKDPPNKVSMRGFQRFLCDSPLGSTSIPYRSDRPSHLPANYGSYHLLYKIDGETIGISVIDILPTCVSSVYFIWNPEYAWASLGKLSALFEVAIAIDIQKAGAEQLKWLYMGYWIANCVKMRYKSEYSPSFLLDPGTLAFHPLSAQLDKYLQQHPTGYHPFDAIETASDSEKMGVDQAVESDSDDGDGDESEHDEDLDFPDPPPPGFGDPSAVQESDLDSFLVMLKGGVRSRSRLVQLGDLQFVNSDGTYRLIRELVAAVGIDQMAAGTSLDSMKDKGILYFG